MLKNGNISKWRILWRSVCPVRLFNLLIILCIYLAFVLVLCFLKKKALYVDIKGAKVYENNIFVFLI